MGEGLHAASAGAVIISKLCNFAPSRPALGLNFAVLVVTKKRCFRFKCLTEKLLIVEVRLPKIRDFGETLISPQGGEESYRNYLAIIHLLEQGGLLT